MKKLLLFLFDSNAVSSTLRQVFLNEYSDIRTTAISIPKYQGLKAEFQDAEDRLLTAMVSYHKEPALYALMDLRVLYRTNGAMPNGNCSGYYDMLHFLDEVEEAIVRAATSNKGNWG